jgi:hypothetical protein
MPDDEKTHERMREAAGQWRTVEPGPRREPAFVGRQKEMLRKLASLVEEQIRREHATVSELQEKVNRLKHGGGV